MPPIFIHAMPAINPSGPGTSGPPQRTTFRPPWVKEGPGPLPLPTAPWTLARTRDQKNDAANTAPKPSTVKLRAASIDQDGSSASGKITPGKSENERPKSIAAEPTPVRKQSKITIVPSMPIGKSTKENGHETTVVSKTKDEPKEQQVPKKKLTQERKNKSIDSENRLKEQKSVDHSNITNVPIEVKSVKTNDTPLAPPLPPPPPPPPGFKKEPVNKAKEEKLEALRSRPRKRPDWGTLMKDLEGQRKLNHVQCNDRSSPLLPKVKVKEGLVYESEKATVHNQLLKEIQSGVCLKTVKTNDRSKPLLEGLRKFRRQLTIEEQIQKAADAVVVEAEPDELDDIDKVRDDLQSTKQMLALELRNKESIGRENKRLLAKILNLESELEREKVSNKQTEKTPEIINQKHEQDVNALKNKLNEQEAQAKELDTMYHDVVSQLDLTKGELEEAIKKNKFLESRLAAQPKGGDANVLMKQPSSKRIPQSKEINATNNVDESNACEAESEYEEETETEEEDETSEDSEADKEALQEKRTVRELKLLTTKLKALKDKKITATKERRSLKDQLKKQQKALAEEKKKYKVLQKEVDKMANLMKDDEEDEENEDKSESEEESESDSESESEESVDEESEGDLPPDEPADAQKNNLVERAKKHENTLTVLKKGNYMMKANIDRLKDELFKQKEMSITLQEDLNAVLAELG